MHFKQMSSKTIYDGKVFKVKTKTIEYESGNTSNIEIVQHNGGTVIIQSVAMVK